MNKRIDELWGKALDQAVPNTYSSLSWTQVEKIKAVFAELLVKECADAADMAYDARCEFVGDYVGEYMGYGKEHGITAWRAE
jgi:hypothetical protein